MTEEWQTIAEDIGIIGSPPNERMDIDGKDINCILFVYQGFQGANAKSAITHYKVLESKNQISLVQIRPSTGRKHQIRVHFAQVLGGTCVFYVGFIILRSFHL